MLNVGDDIIIKKPHWHEGVNVGGRLGRIISITGYVLVEVYGYESNPVKCFRSEVQTVTYGDEEDDPDDTEGYIDKLFGEWF